MLTSFQGNLQCVSIQWLISNSLFLFEEQLCTCARVLSLLGR